MKQQKDPNTKTRLAKIVAKADSKFGTSVSVVRGFIRKERSKNIAQKNVCIDIEIRVAKREKNIRIHKERGWQFALFAAKSLEQYTNTKTESLFIVRKSVGLNEGERKLKLLELLSLQSGKDLCF